MMICKGCLSCACGMADIHDIPGICQGHVQVLLRSIVEEHMDHSQCWASRGSKVPSWDTVKVCQSTLQLWTRTVQQLQGGCCGNRKHVNYCGTAQLPAPWQDPAKLHTALPRQAKQAVQVLRVASLPAA